MTSRPQADARDLILDELGCAPGHVLTVAELARRAGPAGTRCGGDDFERALAGLEYDRQVVVLRHPPPDPHLDGVDLRTVCRVDDSSPAGLQGARNSAEARWEEFLRLFLVSHRCC